MNGCPTRPTLPLCGIHRNFLFVISFSSIANHTLFTLAESIFERAWPSIFEFINMLNKWGFFSTGSHFTGKQCGLIFILKGVIVWELLCAKSTWERFFLDSSASAAIPRNLYLAGRQFSNRSLCLGPWNFKGIFWKRFSWLWRICLKEEKSWGLADNRRVACKSTCSRQTNCNQNVKLYNEKESSCLQLSLYSLLQSSKIIVNRSIGRENYYPHNALMPAFRVKRHSSPLDKITWFWYELSVSNQPVDISMQKLQKFCQNVIFGKILVVQNSLHLR